MNAETTKMASHSWLILALVLIAIMLVMMLYPIVILEEGCDFRELAVGSVILLLVFPFCWLMAALCGKKKHADAHVGKAGVVRQIVARVVGAIAGLAVFVSMITVTALVVRCSGSFIHYTTTLDVCAAAVVLLLVGFAFAVSFYTANVIVKKMTFVLSDHDKVS